jgi:hypothetical protein
VRVVWCGGVGGLMCGKVRLLGCFGFSLADGGIDCELTLTGEVCFSSTKADDILKHKNSPGPTLERNSIQICPTCAPFVHLASALLLTPFPVVFWPRVFLGQAWAV